MSRRGRYVTIDRFRDEATWHRFLTEHGEAYRELDAASERLSLAERELAGGHVVGGLGDNFAGHGGGAEQPVQR